MSEILDKNEFNQNLEDKNQMNNDGNNKRNKKILGRVFFILITFIFVIVIGISYLNTHVYFTVDVSGASMWPTLNNQDVLIANKKKSIQRGDIVIIANSGATDKDGNPVLIIKRVIAFGGETVEIKNGYVYIDGVRLIEPYLRYGVETDNKNWTDAKQIEYGEIFYLGDNREKSSDSRNYGSCSIYNVLGVIESWSISNQGLTRFLHSIFG